MFVNPFFFARKGLFQNIKDLSQTITGKTLDVGCGSKPYEHIYNAREYIGLEYYIGTGKRNKNAEFFYDGHTFPFKNNTFDSIVSNEVFEHVFNPEEFLSEIWRVLKPEGHLLMTIPFVWDEHEQPNDFARYSSFGIQAMLEKHGFKIVTHQKSIDDIRVIFQMMNTYIYKKTVTGNYWINLLSTIFLMAPFNILGEMLARITPKNSDLYLDNIVLAQKVAR
ncbi:MAG: class I SAM-dependent methyltransferase [Candidatus Electrothrix sp. AW5]|nr:class I SAM-dependent methyltransferase [Candidatus Electrothrix gigas]MCI5197403.1 class I SAM-dependent methyltransferase [Candidatus Electrothrix gigas]